jgi:hypothetical protein
MECQNTSVSPSQEIIRCHLQLLPAIDHNDPRRNFITAMAATTTARQIETHTPAILPDS